MNNMEMVREWFEYAESDRRAAAHLFETMRPRPLEIICYHCQQAAEKSLKGYLISLHADPPKTHDLVRLCTLCAEQNPSFGLMMDVCRKMTDYSATARYPSAMEIEEPDAVFALKETEKIYTFCASLIQGLRQEPEPVKNQEA